MPEIKDSIKINDITKYGICPVCEKNILPCESVEDMIYLDCCSCGKYAISSTPSIIQISSEDKAKLSGYLYETKKERAESIEINNSWLCLTEDKIRIILKDPIIPQSASDYKDKLIMNTYKNGHGPVREVDIKCPASGYLLDMKQYRIVLNDLENEGLLTNNQNNWRLTDKGIKYAENRLDSCHNNKIISIIYKNLSLILTIVALIIQIIK